MNEVTLKKTQEWMMTMLVVRGDLREKVMQASAHTDLSWELLTEGKERSTFFRRLNIYAAGYVMRLVECLKSEYPTLESFMGEIVFADFAKAYIVTLPSEKPSLYDLGAGFSLFLQSTRPEGNYSSEEEAFFSLPAEISRVERAQAEVSLAKGFEGEQDELAVLDFFSILQQKLTVKTPPCLRLVELAYPIIPLMEKLQLHDGYDMPVAKLNFVALSRINYRLSTLALESWQFEFLKVCEQEPLLSNCIEITSKITGLDKGDLLARLLFWLPNATVHGLLKVTY
ncbi:DNA-binding domain-containing protein [Pseudoalteromonas fuliginea]|nr:DNA-binding domain-containing protein [Pseudoalteromonas fuliginea]